MRKDVIRIGDTVRIVNPEFFLRCGYPLSLKDGMDMIINDEETMTALGQGIDKALGRKCNVSLKEELFGLSATIRPTRISYDIQKIIRLLAYYRIKNEGFGGNERKIFTKRVESAKDHEFKVIGKKTVTTGVYVPSSGGYNSWSGEYDYDPAYLDSMKAHVILELMDGSYDGLYYFVSNVEQGMGDTLKIEKCNVEQVNKETDKVKKNMEVW